MINLRFFSILLFSSISSRFKFSSSRLRTETYASWFLFYWICFAFSFSILRILAFLFSSSSCFFCRLLRTFSRRSALISCLSSKMSYFSSFMAFIRFVICSEWSMYWLSDLTQSCICCSLFLWMTSVCRIQTSAWFSAFYRLLFSRFVVAWNSFSLYSLIARSISWPSIKLFNF